MNVSTYIYYEFLEPRSNLLSAARSSCSKPLMSVLGRLRGTGGQHGLHVRDTCPTRPIVLVLGVLLVNFFSPFLFCFCCYWRCCRNGEGDVQFAYKRVGSRWAQVGDILVCKCFHFEAFSAFNRCIKHKLAALTAAEFITFSAKRIRSFTFRIFYVSLYFCVALLIYNISCGRLQTPSLSFA